VLCEHNPHRRCNVNFAPKYLVNDLLKAKCDAPIRVEIIDRATGVPLGEDIADLQLEVWVTYCMLLLAAELASVGDVLCAPAWPPAPGGPRTRLRSCGPACSPGERG